MRKAAVAFAACLAVCAAVSADQCCPRDETRTWRFLNDTLRVESVTDAKDMRRFRQYVRITRDGQVVAELNGAGFDTLAASANESLFVGLSNQGVHGTAVVVFDRDGGVRLQIAYQAVLFDYCAMSISTIRHWHGSEASDVHFEDGDDVNAISLLDCRGNRVNLLDTVSKALAGGERAYREWMEKEKAAEK